ncbi:F-box only protein 47-like [Lytechinus pictus]|uniref:F-box only protein 47-like n=1 Tax=Lytechinus pictus TaxID=7653 RepID=UPI0030B9FEE0
MQGKANVKESGGAEKMMDVSSDTPTCTYGTIHTARRSKRLQRKAEDKEFSEAMNNSPLGYFSVLPEEVMYIIFSKLPTMDLSHLTLVSKSMRDIVMAYNLTKQGINKLLSTGCARNKSKKKRIDLCYCFKDLGLLVKRSTCLYPTKERLRLMETLFKELTSSVKIESSRVNYCFGQFLSIFVRGWEEKECHRAYFAIIEHQNLALKIASVLTGKTGAKIGLELEVRSFLRGVVLDQADSLEDLAMWLHFILKPYPMVHQARVLLLLYGPLSRSRDQIDWTFMTNDDPISAPLSSAPFRDLAVAIKALHKHRDWNTDSVISVLEELTGCPTEWQTENTARLLVMCGESICVPVLASKAINGKTSQLSSVIVALALVTYLSSLNMSWLIHILQEICKIVPNEHDVEALIDSVVDYFRHIIVTIPDNNQPGHMMIFEDVVEAYTSFTKELMVASIMPSYKLGLKNRNHEE